MGKIKVTTCGIEGVKLVEPAVFGDARGYFMETYNYNDFKEAGIDQIFVQDNQSASVGGVLRGLHFQKQYPQDKLVRVVSGEVFDVAVDLREGSKTYGKWFGSVLSAENKKQLFLPIFSMILVMLVNVLFDIAAEKLCARILRSVGLCGVRVQMYGFLSSGRRGRYPVG